MGLGQAAGLLAFEDLLDQVDATPGCVEFIAGQLVGGTGCIAETAVHAVSQYAIGLFALVCLQNRVSNRGFHSS